MEGSAHFRAHGRRPVQLTVTLRGERAAWERPGRVVDLTLAGAGLETEDPLTPGERITIAFATPTLWDPLVLSAVVAWAHPSRPTRLIDALGRPKHTARGGIAFDYPTPDATMAMFDMLVAIGFE